MGKDSKIDMNFFRSSALCFFGGECEVVTCCVPLSVPLSGDAVAPDFLQLTLE